MKQFYDKKETRQLKTREKALFRVLPSILSDARLHAPALDKHLGSLKALEINSREALAQVPVLRKSDLMAMQAAHMPFGGLTATQNFKRLLVSPGPIFDPEGNGSDWWGAARALFAAGIRKGDIILNCFSYHLTPGAHIMESGAIALGCPVIPAGVGNTEQQLEAIHHLRPVAYCGTPDFLKILLDKAPEFGRDVSSIKKALVSGAAFPPSLQKELAERGIEAYQAYATADLGIIAYESSARSGLITNENIILEIVKVGSNEPCAMGEVGEIVVTRLNPDYPLLRFGTGDLSMMMEGQSPCGRSNFRIKGWMGRADQTAKVKGMFVRPEQIQAVLAKFNIKQGRLIITREGEQDAMSLRVVGDFDAVAVGEALQGATKIRGAVVSVASLPNDGKVIEDARAV